MSPAAASPAIHLPSDRAEWIEAWGMSARSMAYVYRPSTVDGIREVFDTARKTDRKIGFKGGGNSYGDAFQNREQIVLDLSRMNRVLEWNPESGVITLEPGVRIADLWRYAIEDGWWPPVVSGTMWTTMGGCAAMNIHGKNAYEAGPFGNHVLEFEFLLPTGELRRVTRASDPELFVGAISGFGILGCFTKITLQMKRVYSGNVEVFPKKVRNIAEHLEMFEEKAATCDYMVGWADCFPSGKNSGRGEMHFARHLEPGEDAAPAQSLRVENQELPDTLFGFLPKSIIHRLIKPFVNDFGMKMINNAKWSALKKPGAEKPYLQSHAGFAFLLDYVPGWKKGYLPGGLIQYQSFVPKDAAARVFAEQLSLSRRHGIVPYLGVTKKHIEDDFLVTHGVDGYSLALDYPFTESNRKRLWKLCHAMDEIVLAAGGRFYFAKDSTMRRGTAHRYLPSGNIARLAALKAACDPDFLLSTNLYRRIFGSEMDSTAISSLRGARNAAETA
ncbi:FAD-binding oxidoreductase [soil metagenome]